MGKIPRQRTHTYAADTQEIECMYIFVSHNQSGSAGKDTTFFADKQIFSTFCWDYSQFVNNSYLALI